MMKWILYSLVLTLAACTSNTIILSNSNFKKSCGLEERINLNGYYTSQFACDSTFFSIFKFYKDGQFKIATTSELTEELTGCFINEKSSFTICEYPIWGTYQLIGDTIKTQIKNPVSEDCIHYRDYLISGKDIINISDYVNPAETQLGYMKNYPSFQINQCAKAALFIPISN